MLQKEKYRKVRKKAGRQGVVQPEVQELKVLSKDPSLQPAWVLIPPPALLTEFCTAAAGPTPPSSHSHKNKDCFYPSLGNTLDCGLTEWVVR